MQKRIFHTLLLVTILSLGLAPYQAHACTCATPLFFWQEIPVSEAVFAGTLTTITYPPPAEFISSADPITYTFTVDSAWKGIEGTQVEVSTVRETPSCGAGLTAGYAYIVYAYRAQNSATLSTNLCTYTHSASIYPYWRDTLYLHKSIFAKLGLRPLPEIPY